MYDLRELKESKMSRSIRRFALAAVLIVVILVVGTIGGFFNVSDLINGADISVTDNAYGGQTFIKVSQEDKVITWPEEYDENWMPTIGGEKGYMYTSNTDSENYLLDVMIAYKTDKNVEEVISFYSDFYIDTELIESSSMDMVIGYDPDGYEMTISIKTDNDKTEVTITGKFPNE